MIERSYVEWYMNRLFVLVALVAMFILGQVCYRAQGASYDPFVQRLEILFHVSPGQPIPVNMQAPDIRLLYNHTRPVGHGCYEVNVCRIR